MEDVGWIVVSAFNFLAGVVFGVWRTYRAYKDDWRDKWRYGYWRGWDEAEGQLWQDAMEMREQYGKPYRHSIEVINGFELAADRLHQLNQENRDNDDPQSLGYDDEAT